MRKALVVIVSVGLLAASLAMPAEAGKKKKKKAPPAPARIERVVEFEYDCPCGFRVMGQGLGWQLASVTGSNTGGGEIGVGPDDLYVTGKAEDGSGQPVRVALANDTNGDGLNDTWGVFCGETSEGPIKVEMGEAVVRVFVTGGTCDDGTPAVATGGKITFTFSNMP